MTENRPGVSPSRPVWRNGFPSHPSVLNLCLCIKQAVLGLVRSPISGVQTRFMCVLTHFMVCANTHWRREEKPNPPCVSPGTLPKACFRGLLQDAGVETGSSASEDPRRHAGTPQILQCLLIYEHLRFTFPLPTETYESPCGAKCFRSASAGQSCPQLSRVTERKLDLRVSRPGQKGGR